MPVKDVVIRAQELGGRWTAIGSDSARGITVEDLSCDADTWGSRSAAFTLRRNGRVPWPDIGAFAPVEIESQGIPIWSGRVKGTPTTDGSDRRITVNCEGWQYHLDDDVYLKTYVQTDLTQFADARSMLTSQLSNFPSGGLVSAGDGSITLSMPNAVPVLAGKLIGVTMDFGPSLCSNVAINWLSSNNTAAVSFVCSGNDIPDGGASATDLPFTFAINTGAAQFNTATFATPHRYVNMYITWPTTGGTPAADIWVKIIPPTAFFSSTTYATSGVSVLPASTVVADAISKATLLLNASTSKITTTSFAIPDLAMSKPSRPRDVINAVNAYHNYQARVTVDKFMEFRPLPASAAIQVDQRSEFDEASAGDASEIYSSVSVSYTDSSGHAQQVARSQPASAYTPSVIQPTNPGAEVNTTGWSLDNGTGTLSRTTVAGEFSAGVAGFKLASTNNGGISTSAWSGGTFVAGTAYRMTFDLRNDSVAIPGGQWVVQVNVNGVTAGFTTGQGTGSFVNGLTVDWVQVSTTNPAFQVRTTYGAAAVNLYIDNLILYEGAATVVNRRGFRRTYLLDTNMSLTPAGGQQIGDVFLAAHKVQPFKGKLVVTGHGTARKTPSGVSMPTAELLLNAGELVRFSHLIDPDTGAIGREGRIAAVSWDAPSDTATIEIDSQSQNFEAFIARLAILTGQVK